MSEPSQESNPLFQPRFKSMILMIRDCGFLRKTHCQDKMQTANSEFQWMEHIVQFVSSTLVNKFKGYIN